MHRFLATIFPAAIVGLLVLLTVPTLSGADDPVNSDSVGILVPDGFHVSRYADDDLAHDIFSMTIDSFGRIVVSGPGYVRILIDEDGDGTADSFKQFADGPRTGAQGMYFLGRDLLCTGDAGLIRYRDKDGDDRADGPPDLFWRFKTGSEHNVHALRKGPDGWWYLIAGNMADISADYVTLPTSPVKQPDAGALLRFTPNLSGAEVYSDGFRNAYDFDFSTQGDIYAFDSDGERDVSLPWYVPTRVFQVLPGSNLGWRSLSWKRPDYFADMPPVVDSFGRGSPTGVTSYRHTMFPKEYQDALIVSDWTFGRAMAIRLLQDGSTCTGESSPFMSGVGQFGFAPTGMVVGTDGSLYVCVGGRGTRGGVFRVTYGDPVPKSDTEPPQTPAEQLAYCLEAPQPLSSWSRTRWTPIARQLGRETFLAAALNEANTAESRLRAIEILTEMFGGLSGEELSQFSALQPAAVRARAVWSHGRSYATSPDMVAMSKFLNDEDPLVVRCALEAILDASPDTDFGPVQSGLAKQLAADDRFVRQTAARVVGRLNAADTAKLAQAIETLGSQAAVTFGFGLLLQQPGFNEAQLNVGLKVLSSDQPIPLKLEAARLMQLALGDMGPGQAVLPVFVGYASALDLTARERDLDSVRIALADIYPAKDPRLDVEIGRLIAMLTPYNATLLDRVLAEITDDSDPVRDIHQLIVAARIPVRRSADQQTSIARALVQIEPKMIAGGLNRDTHWQPHMQELYERLTELDEYLPERMLDEPEFGRPGHVLFLSLLPNAFLQQAISIFAKAIEEDASYPLDNDLIFVLGESTDPVHRELVRKRFDQFALRNAVLIVLADQPEEQDRDKYVAGLESSQTDVLTACIDALSALPPSNEGTEQVALLRTVRRLGSEGPESKLRDKAITLLRRNTDQNFGYELDSPTRLPQTEAVEAWAAWIAKTYPQQVESLQASSGGDLGELESMLSEVDWDTADSNRGAELFRTRSCAQCHGGSTALGPDLAGAAERFSRKDLFLAIAAPNRDVSPRYQTTMIETTEGKVYSGLVIYESVDGLILRNGSNQTFRIESDEIESRRILNSSLMPSGLLQGLKPQDLSDLYAYLSSLRGKQARDVSRKDKVSQADQSGN